MPSLRRSFSSPSVRSSPYLPSSARLRTSPPNPRRSSGSATAERRVLADIEWWRVYDGQCDLDQQDSPQVHPESPGGIVMLSAGGNSLEPLQTLHTFSLESMQSVFPDALVIAPYSPPNIRHGRDSSVESTPELPTAPLETIQLGLADPVSPPFGDRFLFHSSLTRAGGRQPHPLFGSRSVSAPALSHRGTFEPDFADPGGDLFSFDQNLFQ